MNKKFVFLLAGVFTLLVGSGISYASGGHVPIVIQSDTDFASCGCVVSGMGAQGNPYVVGPLAINSGGGNAVYIISTEPS